MDFDTMFFISFFFVCFFFPVFVYTNDPTRYWMFRYSYDETVISEATALCLVGIGFYMTGRLWYKPEVKQESKTKEVVKINTRSLLLISLSCLLVYIALGGYDLLVKMYSGGGKTEGGLAQYFFILSYICIFCMIIGWMYNQYWLAHKFVLSKVPKIEFCYVACIILLMAYSGSRGKIMNIALIGVGLYTYLFHPFTLKRVLFLSVIGILLMFGLVIYRSDGSENTGQLADIVMDLLINSRNTYASLEIVNKSGYSFGMSMLSYILACIPFAQNIIFTLFDIDPDSASSSMIITKYTIGTTSEVGTGTSIIGDLYLAFGFPGVVIFMSVLGYFISYVMSNGKRNIYSLTMYGIMMCFAVFMSRSEYFFAARILVWSLIIINIDYSVCRYLKKQTLIQKS